MTPHDLTLWNPKKAGKKEDLSRWEPGGSGLSQHLGSRWHLQSWREGGSLYMESEEEDEESATSKKRAEGRKGGGSTVDPREISGPCVLVLPWSTFMLGPLKNMKRRIGAANRGSMEGVEHQLVVKLRGTTTVGNSDEVKGPVFALGSRFTIRRFYLSPW